MILTKQIVNIVDGDTFGKVTESKINANKLHKLYGILSGLYKNIFASIMREYASNQWDSHKMAGKEDEPIVIKMHWDDNLQSGTIKFIDKGLGMSPEVMETVYFNYLDSNKENSNEIIGGWGLGSKSALAYHHTFFIDTIWDGICYSYMFSKQANGIPAGELLKQEPTDECNGVTVIVPVKTRDDFHQFIIGAREQLLYFPNVYVETNIFMFDNNYKLFQHDLFYYNTNIRDTTNTMHMAVGSAYYPISWNELGRGPINIPVAIRFNIGELTPTPSREDIVYTKHSIELINERIDAVVKYLEDSYNEKVPKDLSIYEWINKDGINNNKYVFLTDEILLSLRQADEYKQVNLLKPDIKRSVDNKLSTKVLSYLRFFGYKKAERRLSNDGKVINDSGNYSGFYNLVPDALRSWYYTYRSSILYPLDSSTNKIILLDSEFDPLKNRYIADEWSSILFIEPVKMTKRYRKAYIDLFIELDIPDRLRKTIARELLTLANEFVNDTVKKYSEIVVPQSFIDREEEAKRRLEEQRKLDKLIKKERNNEVPCQFIEYGNYKDVYKSVKAIRNSAHNIIYFEKTDRNLAKGMDLLAKHLSKDKRVKFKVISIAKSHMKLYKDDPHVYYWKDFMEIPNAINTKIATAFIIYEMFEKISYNTQSTLFSSDYSNITGDLVKEYDFLKEYAYKYGGADDWELGRVKIKLIENMTNCNALDTDLINRAKRLLLYSKKLALITENIKVCNPLKIGLKINHFMLLKIMELSNIPVNKSAYVKLKQQFV